MLVVLVVPGGAVARDGRIHPGDYLISVNHETLRKVTNSQARAILRRAQLLSTDIRYLTKGAKLLLESYSVFGALQFF